MTIKVITNLVYDTKSISTNTQFEGTEILNTIREQNFTRKLEYEDWIDRLKYIDELSEAITEKFPIIKQESCLSDELNIFIWGVTSSMPGMSLNQGVGGKYDKAFDMTGEIIIPYVYIWTEFEKDSRLYATFIHEIGHYLRFRSICDVRRGEYLSDLREKIFSEGLSENLVQEIIGEKFVLHSRELNKNEIEEIDSLLNQLKVAQANSQTQPEITDNCYKLGYKIIRNLIDEGINLKDLFEYTSENTFKKIESGIQKIKENSCVDE